MLDFRADDSPMYVFFVEGMVSSRIAGAVARAVQALDPSAKIRADPVTHRLDVEPSSSAPDDVIEMLGVAGFTATLAQSTTESPFPWVDLRRSTGTDSAVSSTRNALSDVEGASLGAHDTAAGVAFPEPVDPLKR